MAPKSTSSEVDLPTSSSEENAGLSGVAPAAAREAEIPWPLPGDVLKSRFVLQQCLAQGPTTRLFRARDTQLEAAGNPDSLVVLKVVTATPGEEPRALQALRREAALGHGLKHPNLPRILGLDDDGPHTFLCMAWLDGESLATILDARGARPMMRVQALHIIEGVGRALTFVHSYGITHADVKPANILVTGAGHATLLDFGVARGAGEGSTLAVRGYTPEYASPEVLGGAEPTPADDLFSLACVAYRMMSGHRAFGSGTAREAAATGTRPARAENLSPVQWRALDRALSFQRDARQPDVATFLAQLKSLRDETSTVTDLSAGEHWHAVPPPAQRQRQPEIVWPAVGVLVGALAGGAVYLWLDNSDRTAEVAGTVTRRAAPDGGLAAEAAAATAQRPADPLPVAMTSAATTLPVTTTRADEPPPARYRATESLREAAAPPAPKPATRPTAAPAAPARLASADAPRLQRVAADAAGPAIPDSPAPEGDGAEEPAQDGGVADTTGKVPTVPLSSLAVRRYVEPEFPRKAAARRVEGWVDVTFTVDASGRTRNVQVINAEPPGVFDSAALSAVRRWRFEADETAGATAPVRSGVRLRFDPGRTRPGR